MPRLEEIVDEDDIDNMDMDLAEFDPDLKTPIAPARPKPSVVRSQDTDSSAQLDPLQQMMKSMGMEIPENFNDPMGGFGLNPNDPNAIQPKNVVSPEDLSEEEMKELKSLQILYPCYFDKNRSEKEGRRVKLENAVSNPLAKTVLDACKSFGLTCLLEPEKSHPQDFGNPGRVRVGIKFEGKIAQGVVKNKRDLLNKVSNYLKNHETTLKTVKQMPGPPELSTDSFETEELPRVGGFKMNTIVPLHSPLTMKHPQTKSVYIKDTTPPPSTTTTHAPVKQKQKIQRVRL
ncbi:hypothetical protein BVG19_g5473 [[Candida] boidinii]|nr:hypothetical protein BVG19_g5473 [[Candida] boidinii]OWB53953.1 hypothetical protein B5S27_g5570 [[Candida] boidinii]